MALKIRTMEGGETTVAQSAVDQLATSLRGDLLAPDAPGYDEARAVWNAMIDRRPALTLAAPAPPTSPGSSASPATTACGWRSAAVVTTSPATPSARAGS